MIRLRFSPGRRSFSVAALVLAAVSALWQPTSVIAGVGATGELSLDLRPTYESVGVYLSFTGDDNGNNQAVMHYRQRGASAWIRGMDMSPDRRETVGRHVNPYYNQWRAALLGLQPDTEYEVRVTVTDPDGVPESPALGLVRTRTDQIPSVGRSIYVASGGTATACADEAVFANIQAAVDCTLPGDTVYVKAGTYPGGVILANSGAPDNYITVRNYQDDRVVIDATDPAIVCFRRWTGPCGFQIIGSYVRLKGFDVHGGRWGIVVGPGGNPATCPECIQPHDVIVEDNILRDGKTLSSPPDEYEGIEIGGKTINFYTDVYNVTLQNNTIYVVQPPGAIKGEVSGPGIIMKRANGGHIIRDNTILFTGTVDIHGKDCINNKPNSSFAQTIQDTDIYRNYCDGITDDAISLDGNAANVRVWENIIVRSQTAISITPVFIGPVYVFRNVIYQPERHWTSACRWIKGGEGGAGYVYFYHNTVVLDDRNAEADFCPRFRAVGAVDQAADGRAARGATYRLLGRALTHSLALTGLHWNDRAVHRDAVQDDGHLRSAHEATRALDLC